MNTITKWFAKPLAVDIAKTDLEEAQRQFLKHEAAAVYHSKMLEFYRSNITSLATYVSKHQ